MYKNTRFILAAGFLSGSLAVMTGAFGAHYLHAMLAESSRLETYKTAVQYQFIHSLALLLTGILYHQRPARILMTAVVLFIAGLVLFCGSLYLICFTGISAFGIVTPLGGVALIAAWISGAWNFIKN